MKNTVLCYIENDGRYLMLLRCKKENDPNRNKYIGVGGKTEEGESPDECLVREVKEETGLEVLNRRYRGIITFVSDECEGEYMHLFTVSEYKGSLIPCSEGDLVWVKKSEVKNLNIWQGDKIFLDLLENDAPFFSLKLAYKGDKLILATLNGKELEI